MMKFVLGTIPYIITALVMVKIGYSVNTIEYWAIMGSLILNSCMVAWRS